MKIQENGSNYRFLLWIALAPVIINIIIGILIPFGLLDMQVDGEIYLPALITESMLYPSLFISPIFLLAYFAKDLDKKNLLIFGIAEVAIYLLSFLAFFWFEIPAFITILLGFTMNFKE